MTSILLALPWAGIIAFLLLIVKPVRRLTNITSLDPERAPSVGVIIPARNEAENIEECLASLTKSRYPNFEIIVVDDRSEDGTAELARTVPAGNAERLVVIDGEALPKGWLGKPWACQQGARATSADLLVFADADTTHGDRLLSRSITELQNEQCGPAQCARIPSNGVILGVSCPTANFPGGCISASGSGAVSTE